MGFLLSLIIIFVFLHDVDNFLVKARDFALQFLASLSQLCDVCLHLIFLLLCHQGLSHAVSYRGFIQCLVRLNRHLDFVSDSYKEKSSLSTIDCDLTDEFIETLRVKLLSDAVSYTHLTLPTKRIV